MLCRMVPVPLLTRSPCFRCGRLPICGHEAAPKPFGLSDPEAGEHQVYTRADYRACIQRGEAACSDACLRLRLSGLVDARTAQDVQQTVISLVTGILEDRLIQFLHR